LEQVKLKVKQQDSRTNEKDYEIKQLQEQFGGIILREIKYKEKELREEFANLEKDLHKEFSVNLGIQIEKKEEEIRKVYEEVDALKMKNVEWVTFQSNLSDKIYKLERDNLKLTTSNQNLLQNFTQAHNELLKTQMEMSQLKREYSELYVTHKSTNARMHLPNDLKNLPSPQDLQKRFSDFVNNNNSVTPTHNSKDAPPLLATNTPTPLPPSSLYPSSPTNRANKNLYPASNKDSLRGSVNGVL